MLDLFEARPRTVSKLADPKLKDAREHADALLAGEFFRTFGIYGEDLKPREIQLLSAMSNMALTSADGDYTVKVGDEHRKIIGCDVILGRPQPADGTTYQRPVAANLEHKDTRALEDKSFAYVPLVDAIEIGTGPERSQAVNPGEIFLSELGLDHKVHIPSWLLTVELVLAGQETDVSQQEWLNYVRVQPNPNL